MSKAKLIIEVDGEELVAEFDVATDDQTATITISPDEIKIHTKQKPELVPIDDTQYGDHSNDYPIFGNGG